MKIDRVIEIVRQYKLDEMMTAGAGGFTGREKFQKALDGVKCSHRGQR